jgi:hypothetical protein
MRTFREEWLTKLIESMRPLYKKVDAKVPKKIRVTCGWPSKRAFSNKNRVIGECWDAKASHDKSVEVFISPAVSDTLEVAEIVAHELVHACGAKGHRGDFRKIAEAIGLEGPMRSTHAGKELKERLNALAKPLGKYPHAKLDTLHPPTKKDGTRLLKVMCEDCGYVVRTTQKWIDVGFPTCPCGGGMELDQKEGR